MESRNPLQEVSLNTQNKDGPLVPNVEDQMKFNKYVMKAKSLASQGNVREALELNLKALSIHNSEKLAKRVEKMKAYLAEHDDDDEDGDSMVHVGDGFYLYADLYDKLYEHQREGILWMWRLFRKRKGGILGDDMGLGKTIQVIAFLSGLFDVGKIHSVLIVLPVAVIANWENEFEKWAPGIQVEQFHGGKKERERCLAKIRRRGGVLVTSYGMLVNNAEQLADSEGREYSWDYTILDEGHKIKNPQNKCARGAHIIRSRNRLLLTGTPVQNNLKEMWALFDWTHQGTLLGTARTFGMEYEQPITRARQKDATSGEQRLGEEIASSLQKIIAPYFLRRTKAQINQSRKKESDQTDAGPDPPKMPTLTHKNDLICWIYLSDVQQKIYRDFVQTDEVKELLNSKRSPLVSLTVLKKICDHPRLLTSRQCHQLGLDHHRLPDGEEESEECAANKIHHMSDEQLMAESGKLLFLAQLIDNLRSDGHRSLIFSQSRKMLDIVQKILTSRGHRVCRLDGTMRHLYEREEVIKKFSRDRSYSVFLLTTQVGGVGLTLTAADRVVIIDPSWNPATDAQAVDRAFRIGQDKNVVIYRLITCGSVEEKIYRRQIFKDSITRQTTGDTNNPYRYFSRQELRELFVLDDPHNSTTQTQLQQLHDGQRRSDTVLDGHIAFLHSLNMFGISDHDLMFSQEAHTADDDGHAMGADYIQSRVVKAQQLLGLEAEENLQSIAQHGHYRSTEVFKEPGVPRPPTVQGSLHPKPAPRPVMTSVSDDERESSGDISYHSTNTASPQSSTSDAPGVNEIQVSSDEDEDVKGKNRGNRGNVCIISSDEETSFHSDHDVVIEDSPQKPELTHPITHGTSPSSDLTERMKYLSPCSGPTSIKSPPSRDMLVSKKHEDMTSPASNLYQHSSPANHSITNTPSCVNRLRTPSSVVRHKLPTSLSRGSVGASGGLSDSEDEEVRQRSHHRRLNVIDSDSDEDNDEEEPEKLNVMSPQEESINRTMESLALQDEEDSDGNRVENSMSEDEAVTDESSPSLSPSGHDVSELLVEESVVEEEEESTCMDKSHHNAPVTYSSYHNASLHESPVMRNPQQKICNSHNLTTDKAPESPSYNHIDRGTADITGSYDGDNHDADITSSSDGINQSGSDIDHSQSTSPKEAESDEEAREEAGIVSDADDASHNDEEEDDGDDLDEADEERYIELLTKSKQLYKELRYEDALHLVLDALEIYDEDERVQAFAIKLHGKIKQQQVDLIEPTS